MVKKKAAKKAAAKKAPARAAKKAAPARAAKKTATRAAKPRGGEQLELIKGVRYADLDRLCRQIGDNRDEVNELKSTGAAFEQSALRAMRVHGVTGYSYAGVILVRNQGDETLTVKRDRKKNASEGGGAMNQPAEPEGEQGTGQEPGNIAESLTQGDDDDDNPET